MTARTDSPPVLEEGLLPHHLAMLREESAIPADVIAERGYRSVEIAAEIKRLGFTDRQARTPALLIPLHDVHGELAGYAIRPDEPRSHDGKVIKYEMPKGWRQRLDVPKRCRPMLGDPSIPLYVTEGAKKADALAARGICAISLNGVWAWRGTNDSGGKTALPDWDTVALNERLVRIVFDSDVTTKKAVRYALVRLKAFLESRGAVVEIVYLPPVDDDGKQGIDDYLAAGGTVEALDAFCRAEVEDATDDPDDLTPEIVINGRHLPEISADCWDVIEKWNERRRFLFQRNGRLARVDRDDEQRAQLVEWQRDDAAFFLERAARFVTLTEDGPKPARLPEDVARDLLITWEKPVPPIKGVVGTPTFTAAGVLVTTPGYQPESRLYYEPIGEPVPAVPEVPSSADLERARTLLLDEWLVDFPFPDESSRAHAVAAALTPIVRELINGPTPLFAIDAPTPGSGKGLLADTIGTLVLGAVPAVMSELRNDEELRKRITSVLLAGSPVIMFDNVNRRLASGVLAAALTAPMWSDRRLGGNETITVPNRAIWVATGNNLDLSGEIARRTVWIRVDPRMDRPWEREGFRHHPLPAWVKAHRHDLLWALLVLAQHWFASGRPAWAGKPMGTFEDWCSVVGGVLGAAGIEGFLANREELYRSVDAESEEWRAFVAAWWEERGAEPVQVVDLIPLVRDRDLIPSVFASARDDASERSLRTRLGRALSQRRDRWFGEYRIVSLGQDAHSKVALYQLEQGSGGDPAGPGPAGPAEVPQENTPISDTNAGLAGPAGPLFHAEGRVRARDAIKEGGARAQGPPDHADQVPQVPQVPQPDTKQGVSPAGPGAPETVEVPHKVPQSPPPTEREPCLGGCGSLLPPGQKCPACAASAIDEWKARKDQTRQRSRPTPWPRNT